MRREALIIYSGSEELRQAEVERIQDFLQGNEGGAWEHYEITVAPDDCSESWLDEYFWNCRSAAYFLLFHIGQRQQTGERQLVAVLPRQGKHLRELPVPLRVRQSHQLPLSQGHQEKLYRDDKFPPRGYKRGIETTLKNKTFDLLE